jgi:hypothetical protein
MAIKGGYYIKARCIGDSWIAHSAPVVRETWDYLLREANHKDNKYGDYVIKRGQLFRTYKQIRDAISWQSGFRTDRYSGDQMKHTMKVLMNHGMITLTGTPRGMIITICKYDYYQNPKNYESTSESTNDTPMGTPRVHQQSTSSNKKVKNVKNKKGNKTVAEKEKIFLTQFWPIYPPFKGGRPGKKRALEVFVKIPMEKIPRVILGVQNYAVYSRDTGVWPSHAKTWLNGDEWENWQMPHEPEPKKESPSARKVREAMEKEIL